MIKKINKKILIFVIIFILIVAGYFILNAKVKKEISKMNQLIECLAREGVVIYGSKYCPYCKDLVEDFGGYKIVKLIYVECSEEKDKCVKEMQTNAVPEIQIKKEIYQGLRDPESIGKTVNCQLI